MKPSKKKKTKQKAKKTPKPTRTANNFPEEVIPSRLPHLIAVSSKSPYDTDSKVGWYYFAKWGVHIQAQLAGPDFERITAQMHTAEQLNAWIHNESGGILKIQRFYVNNSGYCAVDLIPSSTQIHELVLKAMQLDELRKKL